MNTFSGVGNVKTTLLSTGIGIRSTAVKRVCTQQPLFAGACRAAAHLLCQDRLDVVRALPRLNRNKFIVESRVEMLKLHITSAFGASIEVSSEKGVVYALLKLREQEQKLKTGCHIQ